MSKKKLKLKPCPACGEKARECISFISCDACDLTGPQHDFDGKKWNALPRRDDSWGEISNDSLLAILRFRLEAKK